MLKYLTLLIAVISVFGCATSDYDTFRYRESEFQGGEIALSEGGLSQVQIDAILSTKLPEEYPINIAVIFVTPEYSNMNPKELLPYFIDGLRNNYKIERITPIPGFMVPQNVTFEIIQELGIRSLSEYVLVFVGKTSKQFNWILILENEYRINSTLDFFIVDSRTTAMLASDTLFSEIIYRDNIFKAGELEKAKQELYTEQAKLLARKIDQLFPQ